MKIQGIPLENAEVRGVHPLGNWHVNDKGYPRFRSGPHRGRYVHRVVWEQVSRIPIPEGFHVAHQDFDKLNFQPENLVACPPEFNPAVQIRCPWTGRFLSRAEYEHRVLWPA